MENTPTLVEKNLITRKTQKLMQTHLQLPTSRKEKVTSQHHTEAHPITSPKHDYTMSLILVTEVQVKVTKLSNTSPVYSHNVSYFSSQAAALSNLLYKIFCSITDFYWSKLSKFIISKPVQSLVT